MSEFDLVLNVLANAKKVALAYRKACATDAAAGFFRNEETRELQAALHDLEDSINKINDVVKRRRWDNAC
ncbi:hypothetical protein BR63_03010 [Thermanaerosceptrum fracticalcis]|uniref:Uncharacterized protein n=1 Tax=Thermanaerosceptrum fracticalcis TaxID=1712410 RepID=A0A7G6DZW6_THEFR|nr:hypothetical protein [Thermanaerosceptrum fracticalcis]QNB45370.1 hypothetical protein BR63_03010 [Thermanaerosceptrum fracticalcis]